MADFVTAKESPADSKGNHAGPAYTMASKAVRYDRIVKK